MNARTKPGFGAERVQVRAVDRGHGDAHLNLVACRLGDQDLFEPDDIDRAVAGLDGGAHRA